MNAPSSIWRAPYRNATVGFFALAFLVAYAAAAITTAMPQAARELDGLPLYGLAFGITMATSVVSMTLAALWIDRVGPQTPLLVGVAIYVLGMAAAAVAPTMEWLVAARAVQGLGTGLDGVALYVAIARVFPPELRAKMFGALAAAWLLPSIVGPALSGVITDHFGWRWVFATVPVLAVIASVVVFQGTRGLGMDQATPRQPDVKAVTWWHAPAWALAAAVAVLGLSEAGTRSRASWPLELLLAVIVLAVAVQRLLPHGTWRAARGLPSLILMRGLVGAAFTLADVYLPLYMIEQRQLPAWLAGLSLTVGGITWAFGSWLSGRDVLTPRQALRLGAAALLAGLLISTLVLLPGWPVWIAWLGWTAAGFGIGLAYPTLSVVVLAKSAVHEQGANSSALQLSEVLTTATTLAVVGAGFAALLTDGTAGYVLAFGAACALAAATAVVARRAA